MKTAGCGLSVRDRWHNWREERAEERADAAGDARSGASEARGPRRSQQIDAGQPAGSQFAESREELVSRPAGWRRSLRARSAREESDPLDEIPAYQRARFESEPLAEEQAQEEEIPGPASAPDEHLGDRVPANCRQWKRIVAEAAAASHMWFRNPRLRSG